MTGLPPGRMRIRLPTVTAVYVVSVAVNYPWELAQAALFTAESHPGRTFVHCFVASLGDGIMLLLLFGMGAAVSGRFDWFRRPRIRDYIVLCASGFVLAVAIEWVAVHLLHRWSYTEDMPLLPVLDVGLIPLLQMVLLPPVVFWLVARFVRPAAQ